MNRAIIGIMVLIGIIMFVWRQQKQPRQQVRYTYTPRIGNDPSEPEVDEDHFRFQISTQMKNQEVPPRSRPWFLLVQEVTLTTELFRNDQLFSRVAEHRKEASITNQHGDWVDNHEHRSVVMDTFTADRYVYTVRAKLLRPLTWNTRPGAPQLPSDGVLSRDFDEAEFGPAADQASQTTITDSIPLNIDLGYRYTAGETAVEYSYVWEITRDEEGSKMGSWEITFTTPESASSLNDRRTFP